MVSDRFNSLKIEHHPADLTDNAGDAGYYLSDLIVFLEIVWKSKKS